jgi:3-hydroxyisobutyrate dehydrogenase-like beta-hydroxyacid dehydrogenase
MDVGVIGLGRRAIHISMSTISVVLSGRLADAYQKAGQDYVSAPVFERPEAAAAAKLLSSLRAQTKCSPAASRCLTR